MVTALAVHGEDIMKEVITTFLKEYSGLTFVTLYSPDTVIFCFRADVHRVPDKKNIKRHLKNVSFTYKVFFLRIPHKSQSHNEHGTLLFRFFVVKLNCKMRYSYARCERLNGKQVKFI